MIVEDPALAEMLCEALADAGHLAQSCGSETELIAALAAGSFDAALVDLDRRTRDGASLLELLARCAPSTRRIALLPFGSAPGTPLGSSPLAAEQCIEKPARLQQVLEALATRREASEPAGP